MHDAKIVSSVDFQGFIPSEGNTYIHMEIRIHYLNVSEWLILGAVLLLEAQICQVREFKPRSPLSCWQYCVNCRLHRLWLYSLLPSNLRNALQQQTEVYKAEKCLQTEILLLKILRYSYWQYMTSHIIIFGAICGGTSVYLLTMLST